MPTSYVECQVWSGKHHGLSCLQLVLFVVALLKTLPTKHPLPSPANTAGRLGGSSPFRCHRDDYNMSQQPLTWPGCLLVEVVPSSGLLLGSWTSQVSIRGCSVTCQNIDMKLIVLSAHHTNLTQPPNKVYYPS